MASELVASKSAYCEEYVYSAVNVLTNSPNILDQDFFQLNLFQIHGKIG